MQMLEPLAVGDIRLSTGDVFGMARIDEANAKARRCDCGGGNCEWNHHPVRHRVSLGEVVRRPRTQ